MNDQRYYVKDSSIHGRGVFAARRIRAGEFIGRYVSRIVKRDSRYVLWVADGDHARPVGYLGIGKLRFLNHSPWPNAALYGALDFYAIRDVARDEEITFHYGEEWYEGLPGERPRDHGSNATDAEIALIQRLIRQSRNGRSSNRR
ncbi:MAG: SET domain-containing protein [Phycisphaerales bacterium]|nr:MAG: SET domain-containing protein [Phycisphaerales bacterium]